MLSFLINDFGHRRCYSANLRMRPYFTKKITCVLYPLVLVIPQNDLVASTIIVLISIIYWCKTCTWLVIFSLHGLSQWPYFGILNFSLRDLLFSSFWLIYISCVSFVAHVIHNGPVKNLIALLWIVSCSLASPLSCRLLGIGGNKLE